MAISKAKKTLTRKDASKLVLTTLEKHGGMGPEELRKKIVSDLKTERENEMWVQMAVEEVMRDPEIEAAFQKLNVMKADSREARQKNRPHRGNLAR